jgi:hypothetical protein
MSAPALLLAILSLLAGLLLRPSGPVIAGLSALGVVCLAWWVLSIEAVRRPLLRRLAGALAPYLGPAMADTDMPVAIDAVLTELDTISLRVKRAINVKSFFHGFYLPSEAYAAHRETFARNGSTSLTDLLRRVYTNADHLNELSDPGFNGDSVDFADTKPLENFLGLLDRAVKELMKAQ